MSNIHSWTLSNCHAWWSLLLPPSELERKVWELDAASRRLRSSMSNPAATEVTPKVTSKSSEVRNVAAVVKLQFLYVNGDII